MARTAAKPPPSEDVNYPVSFRSLVGHHQAVQRLREMAQEGRVPNGLLLTGAEGVGRRTLARVFAASLLHSDYPGPVDEYSAFAHKFQAGQHPDYHEVGPTGASRQISIDSVREFHKQFELRPLESERRIGVILEADRLTEEAANALLKLLEEPPPSSHLVLVASSKGALLQTLVFRCQWIPLGTLNALEVTSVLRAAGITNVDPLITFFSKGSPGYARKLLETGVVPALLAAALTIARGSQRMFQDALAIAEVARSAGSSLADARGRLTVILDLAEILLRAHLRGGGGSGVPPGAASAMAELSDDQAEARLERLVQAHRALASNVGLDAVLEELLEPINLPRDPDW